MTDDLAAYRPRIREFLSRLGVEVAPDGTMRCPNPEHSDEHPSATCYDTNVTCHVCGVSWDIFDTCGLIKGMGTGRSSFRERVKLVKETLRDFSTGGDFTDGRSEGASGARKAQAPRGDDSAAPSFLPLSVDEAKSVYTAKRLLELAPFSPAVTRQLGTDLEIAGSWTCKDESGRVEILSVRFERKGDRERFQRKEIERLDKIVLGFWASGTGDHGPTVRFKGCPIRLFGRDLLAARPDEPVLIVEGEKCWKAAQEIPGYVPVTWNGGAKKAKLVDWSALVGRTVVIYPDDDDPGRATSRELAARLQAGKCASVRVVEPLPEARKIKPQAADIVEALQVRSPQEMAEYLRVGSELATDNHEQGNGGGASVSGGSDAPPILRPDLSTGLDAIPFRILGTADDGLTYFLDRSERMQTFRLGSLTKTNLQLLAPLGWWIEHFRGSRGKLDVDEAIDWLIEASNGKAFDIGSIRGRGCWRIAGASGTTYLYHDGTTTYGGPDPDRVYQRKTRLDLGLDGNPAVAETRARMWASASALSFETPADCARLLAWSVLAPFCGALPVRPAVFLTGQSGSGKSTVLQYVVKRMARGLYVTNVTEAGIRQELQLDCLPVVVEEAESGEEESRMRMRNVFALMRQSFSDDSPRILKGTTQGRSISYVARSMFLYAAIQPGYEREADANRIAVVDMRKPENNWAEIRAGLACAFTEESCAGVRAFTWAHLAEIIEQAERFSVAVHDRTGMDTRYSLMEGILWAAHWRVWKNAFPSDEQLAEWLPTVYASKPVERAEDDSESMIQRLMDEVMPLFDAPTKRYTVEHLLRTLARGYDTEDAAADLAKYRKTLNQLGLYVDSKGQMCVAVRNHHLGRMLGAQYSRVLARHLLCLKKGETVTPPGETSRRCMVFSSGLLEGEPPI